MIRGSWAAAVHGVAKSQTWLRLGSVHAGTNPHMYIQIAFLLCRKTSPWRASNKKKLWKFYFGRNANNGGKNWPHAVSGKAGLAQWGNGLWNLGDVRGEMKCWQGKGVRADPRATQSSRFFSPTFTCCARRSCFLIGFLFFSSTEVSFFFFFWQFLTMSFFPTLLLSCYLCSFSLSPHLFLTPFPSSLWTVDCLFIYFLILVKINPEIPWDKLI